MKVTGSPDSKKFNKKYSTVSLVLALCAGRGYFGTVQHYYIPGREATMGCLFNKKYSTVSLVLAPLKCRALAGSSNPGRTFPHGLPELLINLILPNQKLIDSK